MYPFASSIRPALSEIFLHSSHSKMPLFSIESFIGCSLGLILHFFVVKGDGTVFSGNAKENFIFEKFSQIFLREHSLHLSPLSSIQLLRSSISQPR